MNPPDPSPTRRTHDLHPDQLAPLLGLDKTTVNRWKALGWLKTQTRPSEFPLSVLSREVVPAEEVERLMALFAEFERGVREG